MTSTSGPFGRCGNIMDDDVLVEVNGKPVLYAGHAGVIASIKSALSTSMEMTVTVCRPAELVKLTNATQSTATANSSPALGPSKVAAALPNERTGGIGRWFVELLSRGWFVRLGFVRSVELTVLNLEPKQ